MENADRPIWMYVFGFAALANLANALWMLADPPGWYSGIPAAVPDSGPLNEHFVRDIGAAFATVAAAFAYAAWKPSLRFPMLCVATVFIGAHALVHVYDTWRGLFPHTHWLIDFPAVYLPAILLVLALVFFARRETR
jgi:hypothetical protein